MVVLAFLVGWLLRAPRTVRTARRRRHRRVVVRRHGCRIDGGVGVALHGYPGALTTQIDQIVHGYFFSTDRIGFADGLRLLEGLGLAAAAVIAVAAAPEAGS